MRIVFDTNVLLDAFEEREDFEAAQNLIMLAALEKIEGVVPASSLTDIYYISRKKIGDTAAREALWKILELFDLAAVDAEICVLALKTPMYDFEDAVIDVCAAYEQADYIVTRDKGFLHATTSVPTITPKELLEILSK